MQLEILTPDKKIYEGEVSSVSLPGITGGFQVLNNHAPLISALSKGTLTLESPEGSQKMNIKSGFVEVLNNRVVVLIEGAEIL